MSQTVRRVVAVAGVSVGVIAARRIATRQAATGRSASSPTAGTVTVNRPPDPLAALGDAVEVRLRPAPGGRGTELAAHLRDGAPAGAAEAVARAAGSDPRQQLRSALRQSKQLLETGEVLSPDEPPTTRRTLRSLPLELATWRARGEGRL